MDGGLLVKFKQILGFTPAPAALMRAQAPVDIVVDEALYLLAALRVKATCAC